VAEERNEDYEEVGSFRNTAWIRGARDAETLAGKGVKCWVVPAIPLEHLRPRCDI
jgi:hypothetical protein